MKRYNPKEIEPKWQAIWEQSKIYQVKENKTKPKRYVLEYFPYPSGSSMHVGHVRNYTIGDVIARHARMSGSNVLHPMGWDAFGLPAENYAIKTGISPQAAVAKNVENFKEQLMQMGFSYDWSREINSTDPNYYKWTQWFFLMLFKKGLAYQQESLQWWCPVDKTVLANEQVENGLCWRCGSEVEKKSLKQWFFKITDYADRLEKDLEKVDWSNSIKTMQRNWIGRSEGASIKFELEKPVEKTKEIEVFTTAHDTIYGVTFMVLAPENSLVEEITTEDQKSKIEQYIKQAVRKSDVDRMETEREKTGVFTGSYAINPLTKGKIPIWVADYVLVGYGTGAIMAVPGEDERDYEFAKKFDLPIVFTTEEQEFVSYQTKIKNNLKKYTLANSEEFDGLNFEVGRQKILGKIEKIKAGRAHVEYKIRDWLISRQRYWGAPIPIIHCQKCGVVPVPEKDLPVVLPDIKSYEPSGDGRSPLANVPDFVNVDCPSCGGKATRETDTMDGFACSSWYFLRFADPHNDKEPFSRELAERWLPVDDYIGGAEHAVMHLLYARFWTKVMFDEGIINFDEPFARLRNHGMILAPDGAKMSKSKGNTIEPDSLISQGYGADSIRLMELFIGPWNQAANWSVEGLGGVYRFLQRVWTLTQEYLDEVNAQRSTFNSQLQGRNAELEVEITRTVHKAIKKVSSDLEELGFNTALAALMECVNELYKLKSKHSSTSLGASNFMLAHETWKLQLQNLLLMIAPFAPHITEQLWADFGNEISIHMSSWPKWDLAIVSEDFLTLAVQVNGKVRTEIVVPNHITEAEAIELAKNDDKVAKIIAGKQIKKAIYVPERIVSLVI